MTLMLLIILDVIMVSAMMLYKSYVLKSLQLQLIHLEFALKQTRKC